MSIHALTGPMVGLVLIAASVWFGREVLNGIDRIYRPSVQAWIDRHRPIDHNRDHNRDLSRDHRDHYQPRLSRPLDEGAACHLGSNEPECRDSGLQPPQPNHEWRSCAQEMQDRVRQLTQDTKGLTGPDPGGRYKAILKEEFVASMMAIQRRCQIISQRCHSNLGPFTHLYIKDLTQCWCLLPS